MPAESEFKPPAELLIGDSPFGITLESIENHLCKIRNELAEIDAELAAEENDNQRYKERLKEIRIKREAVLEVSPDEIFRSLQAVYDFVHQSEQDQSKQGQNSPTKIDIIRTIKNDHPELAEAIYNFYGILRSQPWGYRLGQELFAFQSQHPL